MNKKYKELFSNTLVFSISNIGTKIILFFMVPLYTSYMSTEELGTAELIVSASNLLYPLLSLSFSSAVFRFSFEKQSQDEDILKNLYLILVNVILGAIATGIVCNYIPSYSKYSILLVFLIILLAYGDSYALFVKARGNIIVFALNNVIYVVMLLVTNVLFLTKLNLGAVGYLCAIIISKFFSIVFLFLFGKAPKFKVPVKLDKKLLKEMLAFSIPLIANSIFWWIISYSDKYMLAIMLDNSTVGLYTVANKIPSLVTTVVSVFIEAWTISAFKENANGDDKFYDIVYKIFSGLLVVGVSVILLINNQQNMYRFC